MINRTYFDINENTAKVAKEINSFSNYTAGSATAGYRAKVDAVYKTVEAIQANKPQYLERALYMADRFSKKYADYLNAYYRNEASCPSVMICGAGNFPVRKKEKQNARRDSLMHEYNSLMAYAEKIENLLTCTHPINAADENAIEMLTDKLETAKKDQERMKAANAHYRKHGTMVGYEDFTDEKAVQIDEVIKNSWYKVPYSQASLSNNNAEIHRLEDRIAKLTAIKEAGTSEKEYEGFTVVENAELMRLQIIFPDKPSEAARTILKSHGFKWAPSQNAWQRQLTNNATYILKHYVLPELEKLA